MKRPYKLYRGKKYSLLKAIYKHLYTILDNIISDKLGHITVEDRAFLHNVLQNILETKRYSNIEKKFLNDLRKEYIRQKLYRLPPCYKTRYIYKDLTKKTTNIT